MTGAEVGVYYAWAAAAAAVWGARQQYIAAETDEAWAEVNIVQAEAEGAEQAAERFRLMRYAASAQAAAASGSGYDVFQSPSFLSQWNENEEMGYKDITNIYRSTQHEVNMQKALIASAKTQQTGAKVSGTIGVATALFSGYAMAAKLAAGTPTATGAATGAATGVGGPITAAEKLKYFSTSALGSI